MVIKTRFQSLGSLVSILGLLAAFAGCNDFSPTGVVGTAGWALKNGDAALFQECFTGQKLQELEEFGIRDYITLHQQEINLHRWSVGQAVRLPWPGGRARNTSQILQRFTVNVTDDRSGEFLFRAFILCEIAERYRLRLTQRMKATYDNCKIYQIEWGH